MIVIGSEALRVHGIENGRKRLDIDVVGDYDQIVDFAKAYGNIRACYPVDNGEKLVVKTDTIIVEGEITWDDSNAAQLRDLIVNDAGSKLHVCPVTNQTHIIPSVNLLYMLKMSHRYKRNSPHFIKTMRDIQQLRLHGAKIEAAHEEFYKERMRVTYDYGHPSLMQSKKDFFSDDGIKYVYDHDSIHRAVAHLEKPAYEYYKPDSNEVFCSKEMFDAAPEMVRLLGVLEESYVLALERSQVPFPDKWPPQRSFEFALMKVCTSITSGWFREYAWENYDKVRDLYDDGYVKRFWQAVEEGRVKPHDPEQKVYG